MQPVLEHQYIDINQPFAFRKFSNAFCDLLNQTDKDYDCIVILCIGTDRCTGDSFGPLIGYKLSGIKYDDVFVYGTLDNPVHAKNLDETIKNIYSVHINPMVIAVDACLGKMDHIGCISIGRGSIKPGSGVSKDLPEVGDIFITGIVNFSGFLEFMVLQNTRLSLVMKMADIIALGIRYGLWKSREYKSNKVESIM